MLCLPDSHISRLGYNFNMIKTKRTYGLWSSPISPQMIGDNLKLNDVQWDTTSNTIIWSERRATHSVLVAKQGNDAMRDLTDSSYSPSGRVGYGGGEFTVHDGVVYFVDKGRLFRLSLSGGLPTAITPKFGGGAAPKVSPDGKWLIFVHTYEHQDTLAIVDTHGKQWTQKIASGDDFVMQPAWSPDGKQIAYVAWNHPQMPWNGTELRLINLDYNGAVPFTAEEQTLAGNKITAIAQPEFSPDGRYLSYISDASGWLHFYLYDRETGEHQQITFGEIEHGIPQWIQGNHTYAWSSDSQNIIYIRHENSVYSIWLYNLLKEESTELNFSDYTHFDRIALSKDNQIAAIASSSTIPARIIRYDDKEIQITRRSTTEAIIGNRLSACETVSWIGHDGELAHGLYYAPKNEKFESDGKPPLMVLVHGGPTSTT